MRENKSVKRIENRVICVSDSDIQIQKKIFL